MLKLIAYQFRYTKNQWLGTIPVLLVSSVIVGTSLIGIASASKTAITSIQLFQMLIFFGGFTLFFLISNLIQLLIDIFKDDYRLWTILGASRSQLSLLIGGQFFVIALFSSLIGTFLSIIAVDKYYAFLQKLVGTRDLPNITVSVDIKTFILSLLIVPIIAGVGAYLYSRKALKKGALVNEMVYSKHKVGFVLKIFLGIFVFILWISCFSYLLSDTSSKSFSETLQQTSAILLLLLVHLLIIQISSPYVQMFLVKHGVKNSSKTKYAIVLGKWNILYKPSYLKSLQSSVIIGSTLISGFLLYIQNMYIGSQVNSLQETKFSFLAYMSAPIIIILANIISITILSSNQDREKIVQLKTFGASNNHLLMIRISEAFIQSLITFIVSIFFNIIILFTFNYGVHLLDRKLITIHSVWLPSLIISVLLFALVLGTKMLRAIKIRSI